MPQTVLVTGANGYLGARCVERLVASTSHEVVGAWHASRHRLLATPPAQVHYEECDLRDAGAVNDLFARRNITHVIHTAALLPDRAEHYLSRAVAANVAATAHLLDAAAKRGCSRFVYCSSISVYGTVPCPSSGWIESMPVAPASVYAWTKRAGEECVGLAAQEPGMSAVTLRLAGIHGVGRQGGVLYDLVRAAIASRPLTVDDTGSRFQLLFLNDAVDAALRAVSSRIDEPYSCINVASAVFPSLAALAVGVRLATGSRSRIESRPAAPQSDQIMNTARAAQVLGVSTGDLDANVRAIRDGISAMDASRV